MVCSPPRRRLPPGFASVGPESQPFERWIQAASVQWADTGSRLQVRDLISLRLVCLLALLGFSHGTQRSERQRSALAGPRAWQPGPCALICEQSLSGPRMVHFEGRGFRVQVPPSGRRTLLASRLPFHTSELAREPSKSAQVASCYLRAGAPDHGSSPERRAAASDRARSAPRARSLSMEWRWAFTKS